MVPKVIVVLFVIWSVLKQVNGSLDRSQYRLYISTMN